MQFLFIPKLGRGFFNLIVFHFSDLDCLLPCLFGGITCHFKSVPKSVAFVFQQRVLLQTQPEHRLLDIENIFMPFFLLGYLHILAPLFFLAAMKTYHALHAFWM